MPNVIPKLISYKLEQLLVQYNDVDYKTLKSLSNLANTSFPFAGLMSYENMPYVYMYTAN